MKGLIVSLLMFALFIVLSATVSHVLKLKRHLHVFAMVAAVCTVGYLVVYQITPADFYFLPESWQCRRTAFDRIYGLVVLFLNCHSFVDAFFAGCTGFSVSMLMAISQHDRQSMTTAELVALFTSDTGVDRIYGWRIPYLESKGHIQHDPVTGSYTLTTKGRRIATLAAIAKWLLNLGEGG